MLRTNDRSNKIDHVLFTLALIAIMAYFIHGVWGKIPFETTSSDEKPIIINASVTDFLADNNGFSSCSNNQCSLIKKNR